jgi:ParB family chromosome partitioning protein
MSALIMTDASWIQEIDLDNIAVLPDRMRALRPEVIDALVESIKHGGQLQPIIVRQGRHGFILVAGLHRFEAAKKLKSETIRAEVRDLDDDEALLVEIDENLIRADLSPAERALHIGKRKELYERAHPETKHGGDRKSVEAKSSAHLERLKAFVKETARKIGKGRSTIQRDATRSAKVKVLADIAGTSLDKGAEIDVLAKLPESEQRKLAERAKAGEKVSAKPIINEAEPTPEENQLSVDAFINATHEEQQCYLDAIGLDKILRGMSSAMIADLHKRFLAQYRHLKPDVKPKPLTTLQQALGLLAAEQAPSAPEKQQPSSPVEADDARRLA